MKTIYRFLSVAAAAFLFVPALAQTQKTYEDNPEGVILNKWASPSADGIEGHYTLTLEAYVTGNSVTTITDSTQRIDIPCDIALLLDESASMRSNWLLNYTKGSQITSGTLSSTGNKVYMIHKDGQDYYLRGFYSPATYNLISNSSYTLVGSGLSYNGLGSNTYYVQYTDGNYYQVTRGGSSGSRYLRIQVDGTWRYLNGTSFQNSAPSGKNNNTTIWSGNYYSYSASSLSFEDVCNISGTSTNPIPVSAYNEYYVQYDGNYYQVTPNYYSSSTAYYLTITVNNQKKYLNGTNFSDAATGPSDRTTAIWTGNIYTKAPATGDVTYTYVYSTSIPAKISDGTIWYTGSSEPSITSASNVFDTSIELITRERIMKDAAKEFINTVYNNNPEGKSHYISVGWYNNESSGGWLIRNTLTALSDNSVVRQFTDAIEDISTTSNGTRPDVALGWAYDLFNTSSVKTDGRNKVVVLFTDGEPTTSRQTFEPEYGRNAVTKSNQIKNNFTNRIDNEGNYTTVEADAIFTQQATVYSVGFLDKETSDKNSGNNNQTTQYDIRRFLHYLSSNYNIGTSLQTSYYFGADHSAATCLVPNHNSDHGSEAPHDYYLYSDGYNLSMIFKSIAESASHGSTVETQGIKLDGTSTSVVDIVSTDFKLPDGIRKQDITAYSVRTTGYSSTGGYTWSTTHHADYTNDDITISGNKVVAVKGFDFTKEDTYNDAGTEVAEYGNWVGPREVTEGGVTTTTYQGEKLIIEIPIVVNQETYQGGYNTPTNTSKSGIVKNYGTNNPEEIAWFPIPKVDFPCISIAKWGLDNGESATFEVKRIKDLENNDTSGPVYNVILVQGDPNHGTYTATYEGVPYEYTYVIIKDVPEGIYQVTESTWSWTYNVTNGITKIMSCQVPDHLNADDYPDLIGSNLNVIDNGPIWTFEDEDGNMRQVIVFHFDNEKKDSALPNHGEDSKINKMYIEPVVETPGSNTDQTEEGRSENTDETP